jgi:hypothetical protein
MVVVIRTNGSVGTDPITIHASRCRMLIDAT